MVAAHYQRAPSPLSLVAAPREHWFLKKEVVGNKTSALYARAKYLRLSLPL